MSTIRFIGTAPTIAQVDTLTIGGTIEVGDLFLAKLGKTLSYSATSTTAATDATGFAAAWNALSSTVYPEFGEITAAATAGGALTLTGDTAGVGLEVTATTTESDGSAADAQTFVRTATTAVSGPNVYSTAANWSAGAAPVAGDTVHIDSGDIDILYGLSNAGATLAALHIWQLYTGDIGLPKINDSGDYPEYRTDYLAIDATLVYIGNGPGRGSGRIKLNNGTVQTAVTVYNTGRATEPGLEAFWWKGTHASNTMIEMGAASVGVAVFGGEVATIATLTTNDSCKVRCGIGTTLTTVNANGGTLDVYSNVTTLTVYDGVVNVQGTAAISQLYVYGGRVNYNSTGTLGGNTVVGERGYLDFAGGAGAVAVTNPIDVYSLGSVNDPDKRVAALVIDYNGLEPISGCGANRRVTFGTPA